MDKAQKQEAVAELNSVFGESESIIITHYTGLTVSEVSDLRARLLGAGASFKVTKNRLAKIALEGTRYESLKELFTGPTAIAYSSDPVAAAKVAHGFAKENDKLVIIGGALGDKKLEKAEIDSLAQLPSLDELRGKLIGMVQTPATRLATLSQAPASQLARVFGAYGSSA